MGMTMSQKILAKHAGLESVSAGQLIMAELDLVHGNDITSPVAIREMKKLDQKDELRHDQLPRAHRLQSCMLRQNLLAHRHSHT